MSFATPVVPDTIKKRLLQNENVIWWGRPRQGLMLTSRDAFLIPFSLLWGGFAIFWEANVLRMPNAPLPFALFGMVFVLIGLFMIFGQFVLDSWIRGRLTYALTDRRVLITRDAPSASFKSVNLDRLPEATLNEGTNGRGTIRFGAAVSMFGYGRSGFSSWIPALDPTPQFIGIDDVQRVFSAIQLQAA